MYPLNQGDFNYISQLVFDSSGINLHEGKKELVRCRLSKRLKQLKLTSFDEYCIYLKETTNKKQELVVLLNILSTNVTKFFREKNHFHYLEEELPTLILRKQAENKTKIRLWSAGCSSGEEAYSIALLLHEALEKIFPRLTVEQRMKALDIKLIASDISAEMLERAQKGNYKEEQLKNLPENYKKKFFSQQGEMFQLKPEILKMVEFRRMNLIESWPFRDPFDVVFCCNVMIYFKKETRIALLNKLYHALSIDGYIFLAHSEWLQLSKLNYKLKYIRPSIYQRIGS